MFVGVPGGGDLAAPDDLVGLDLEHIGEKSQRYIHQKDGSLLAQMGAPDMRTPIAQALAWPGRITSGVQCLDLAAIGQLDFAEIGGTLPAVLNAANEVAVQAFLDRRLNFTGIAAVIDQVLQHVDSSPVKSLDDVLEADATARRVAAGLIEPARGAFA